MKVKQAIKVHTLYIFFRLRNLKRTIEECLISKLRVRTPILYSRAVLRIARTVGRARIRIRIFSVTKTVSFCQIQIQTANVGNNWYVERVAAINFGTNATDLGSHSHSSCIWPTSDRQVWSSSPNASRENFAKFISICGTYLGVYDVTDASESKLVLL